MDTPFKPRAQILLQLGEQLIKNENIAILELVKNAYDADAKTAIVRLNKAEDLREGFIEISDDGIGMDLDTVANIWMEPGNNHKKKIVEENQRSALGRLPIGEKGIGRFGVHKLGKTILMVSRKKGCQEVVLEINWDQFESAEYLDDVSIHIEERQPTVFTNDKTGTYIKVGRLSSVWTRGMVRSLYRSLNTLNSPFESDKSFKTKLYTDRPEWLEGIMTFEDIKEYALFECQAALQGNTLEEFQYLFKPYELMLGRNLKERTISQEYPIVMRKEVNINGVKEFQDIDLAKFNIGTVKIHLYVFDRDASVMNHYIPDKRAFRNYLDENGGVCVLRDGIRILNYGEPGNDWLELDSKRVNAPSQRISNNLVLGAVYLNRSESFSLKEKANREGFIEDDAYECFCDAVKFFIGKFTSYRNIDKENMRVALSGRTKEPVKENISEIRKIVSEANIDEPVKKQLDTVLKRVEDELELLKQRYVRTANAGLSYGIVIHEIEKIIGELKIAAKEQGTSEKIRSLSNHLSKLIESYSELLRNKRKSANDLKTVIKQALFSVEYRLNVHEVYVDNYAFDFEGDSSVSCAPNMVVGAIINLIDNSIYWTTYSKVEKRKIYISITNEIDGYISIVVADNGMGYQISGEDAIKPFVSQKTNGLGLGLNIVNEIMLAQNGKIIFPEKGDISLPCEYADGAVTVLAFRLEDK